MANLILLARQRERVRGRPRPEAKGNFIAARVFSQWYSLTFPPTDKHYIENIEAKPVFAKAIGYTDNPAPKPAWVPVASIGNPGQLYYPPTPQVPPRTPPSGIPQGVNPVLPISARPGSQGTLTIDTVPMQIANTKYPIRRVTVVALSTNADVISTGYDQTISTSRGFRLSPGAARDYDIDDLSQLWLVSTNGTDEVDYVFEV